MPAEIVTENLLEFLLKASSPEEYLSREGSVVERKLSDYLFALLSERGMTRAQVVRASALNASFVYDIFAGKSLPGRDNAIMLAFGLSCSLVETQRLLRLAGVAELWPKVRRDAIIIWCVNRKMTRGECDDELYRLGEKTLLPGGVNRVSD